MVGTKVSFWLSLGGTNYDKVLTLRRHMQMGKFQDNIFFLYDLLPLTGKSFSEALILASTNPQYDKRLFTSFHVLNS